MKDKPLLFEKIEIRSDARILDKTWTVGEPINLISISLWCKMHRISETLFRTKHPGWTIIKMNDDGTIEDGNVWL